MNTDRELMQQALDALEVATTPLAKDRQEVLRAQAALRERLAQPIEFELDWDLVEALHEALLEYMAEIRRLHSLIDQA